MATDVTISTVVSYTAFPPLRQQYSEAVTRLIANAVYLCCTILGVTSTRRYLASCPAKPGLSSPMPFRLHGSDHLSYSGTTLYHNSKFVKEQIEKRAI